MQLHINLRTSLQLVEEINGMQLQSYALLKIFSSDDFFINLCKFPATTFLLRFLHIVGHVVIVRNGMSVEVWLKQFINLQVEVCSELGTCVADDGKDTCGRAVGGHMTNDGTRHLSLMRRQDVLDPIENLYGPTKPHGVDPVEKSVYIPLKRNRPHSTVQ